MKIRLLLLILLVSHFGYGQSVIINEIMADNNTTISDNKGNYQDWIELRNLTGTDYDLKDHYISDKSGNITKFRFTSSSGKVVVPANGYLIIWASGNTEDGDHHTGFSLSATEGESVVLTKPDGETIMDQIDFPPLPTDISYGRDSYNNWVYFSPASPGSVNKNNNGYSGFLTPPDFSRNGGFFNANFSLSLNHSEPGVTIYYTLDGSDPDPGNLNGAIYLYKQKYVQEAGQVPGPLQLRTYQTKSYSGSISIKDRSNDNNEISSINSSLHNDPESVYIPSFNVKKATIVRAIATKPGYLPSPVVSQTYIYSSTGTNPYSFPIASVITQENNLFDYNSGIYTAGKEFDDERNNKPAAVFKEFCGPGNYRLKGSITQKPGNFEFFENNLQVVNQNVGIRLNGGCTATYRYKSLRLYGTNRFDEYPFFDNHPSLYHSRLILRNSGNDQFMTIFKDEFVSDWMSHLNFGIQKYKPSIVYLNGEYWGIHNLRERIDKYFLKELYDIDPDNIDLRKVNYPGHEPDVMSEGDDEHYNYMFDFIMNNDMSNSNNYKAVQEMLVVESLIDLYIAHIFIGNIDWPQNNVRLWRTKNEYDKDGGYSDGRWRYIFFDADRGLGEILNAQFEDLTEVIDNVSYRRSEIFVKLLGNDSFKNDFINRFADLLNTSFRHSFSTDLFDGLKDAYEHEIVQHIQRWRTHSSKSDWQSQIDIVRNYLLEREEGIKDDIKNVFNINGTYELTAKSQDMLFGHVKVNSIDIVQSITRGLTLNGNSWKGDYFQNIPIKISAVPNEGYEFTHWMYNGSKIYNKEITVNTGVDVTYEAFFEFVGGAGNEDAFPQAANIKECGYTFNYWSSDAPKGSFPENGAFVYWVNKTDPLASDVNAEIGFTNGLYDLESRTRINGLGSDGFSFINTSNGNDGYEGRSLGGFLLAIKTQNVQDVLIGWKAKTITTNTRKYKLRLLYRVGDEGDFTPLGPEYHSGLPGHTAYFDNIELPPDALDEKYVQLLWQYYYTGIGSSARDELAITEIKVYEKITRPENTQDVGLPNIPGQIFTSEKLNSSQIRHEKAAQSITLNPGFEAKNGAVFKAEIESCP